ncbi:TPA: ead/Ea22-like family protein, partial [Klebsiella pneumoniae]
MTDITELAQSLKAAAEKATQGNWRAFQYHDGRCGIGGGHNDEIMVCEHISKERPHDAMFIALANPANVLALVEALETEKRICATWRKTAESTSEKLEKAQAAERRWHRVASRVHEQACESDVKIDELEAIRAAAEKLVRCKGRYHSEQNYRALAALFGVTTPDLPPLDSESSAVTVKLTDINEFLAEVHDKTLNRAFRLLAEGVRAGDVAAMRAAG